MKPLSKTVIGLCLLLGLAVVAPADEFDLTGTVLSGSNPYTFEHAELGTVTLTYSGSYKNDGLTTNWAGVTSIGLGELAGTGILTVDWQTPITSLDIRYYDLDLSERVQFTVPAGVNIALLADNPLDGSDFLDGDTLKAGAGSIANANTSNYAVVGLSGDPFTTFTAGFWRPSGDAGSSLSFGNPIPEPSTLIATTLAAIALVARRRTTASAVSR